MNNYKRSPWLLVALSIFGIFILIIRWTIIDPPLNLNSLAIQFYEEKPNIKSHNNWVTELKSMPVVRRIKSTSTYAFLIWNLFLAWIPFLLALLFSRSIRAGKHWLFSLLLLLGWLAFLPNGPYIITDFLHLKWRHPIPHWFDLLLLFSFAYTGLALALASVFEVQRSIANILSKRISWLIAMGSLILSGIGIYLGRVLRFNSWDLLDQPGAIITSAFQSVLQPLSHPGAGMGWVLGLLLCLIYLWEYQAIVRKSI